MAYLSRDGVAISYHIHGPATGRTPLLLTHGYGASAAMWQPNLAALVAGRQVVTWDMRGHGQSDSPADPSAYSAAACVADMTAILDACGIHRAAIGGMSLGGYLSLAFHLAHPGRVAALLLFGTGPGFSRSEPRQQWNERAEARAAALDQRGLGALSGSPESRMGEHNPAGLAFAARGMLTQHDASVIESLPSIAVPALVLVGANDRAFLRAADYMATKIPEASKTVIDDAGHAANIDQPAAFNAAVTDFLGRCLDGAPHG